MQTEKQARKRGAALMRKLKGAGWKLRVWENLGWHYGAHLHTRDDSACLSVHSAYGGEPKFGAMLSTHCCAGNYNWHDPQHRSYANPNMAVRRTLKRARAYIERWQKRLDAMGEALQ